MHSISSGLAGIYIHIPFCIRKCPYCDFYSVTDLKKVSAFVDTAKQEIDSTDASITSVDTIYFGGGTPSAVAPEYIVELMDAVSQRFAMPAELEVTMEVNPGTVTPDKLITYRRAGINRLNIGVQSFQDPLLLFLGRIHNAAEALDCLYLARQAGFKNIGIDLIYGLPGQTEKIWESDLKTALTNSPEHLSCYSLTYEPGTPMTMALDNGRIQMLSDEQVASLFDMTDEILTKAGYIHYEISNYASSSFRRSKHNLKYWSFTPYIGIGPSAHSFINNMRYWNVKSVDTYLKRIEGGHSARDGSELLDMKQQLIETIYLGLRCNEGILLENFESRFALNFVRKFGGVISHLEKGGYLSVSEKSCCLTPKGMLFLDSIAARFIYEI